MELARKSAEGPLDLGSVSRSQRIPELYLSKLAAPLKAAGILRSSRGARGGFELARRPEEIDLFEVVEALEGRSSLLDCTEDPGACERSGDCAALPIWQGLDAVIRKYLEGITLAEAAGRDPGLQHLTGC
jgi:Rrf2 family protein